MGNACSCLHNKTGENTYLYPPDATSKPAGTNFLISHEMANVMDDSTHPPMKAGDDVSVSSSILQKKSQKASLLPLNGENQHGNIVEEDPSAQMTKLIGFIKMRYFQRHFKKLTSHEIKRETIELYEQFVKEHSNEYVIKAEQLYPPYSPTGWMKFYTTDESFQPHYDEMLFDNIVLFSYEKDKTSSGSNSTGKTGIATANSAYYGQCNIHFKKHGYGTLIMKDGSKYIGYWDNNIITGWSRIIDSTGTINQGVFKTGILNGKGERILLDGHKYVGDFVNGLREGEGMEESKEMSYQGRYKNDKRSGKGEMHFASGDVYKGEFENNCFHGQGHYTWKGNGHEYIGSYVNNVIHGKGLYKWNANEYYDGEYVQGIKEGTGEFKWSDGRKYMGTFKNGVPDGIGICESVDKKTKEVQFINGKLNRNYIRADGKKEVMGQVTHGNPPKI